MSDDRLVTREVVYVREPAYSAKKLNNEVGSTSGGMCANARGDTILSWLASLYCLSVAAYNLHDIAIVSSFTCSIFSSTA
jgi:hypothetical protein